MFFALVAGHVADGVFLAQLQCQTSGDFHQKLVTPAVTDAVVDALEVVEVDEQ